MSYVRTTAPGARSLLLLCRDSWDWNVALCPQCFVLSPTFSFPAFRTASSQLVILGHSIPFSNILMILDLIEEKFSSTNRLFPKSQGEFWNGGMVLCVLGDKGQAVLGVPVIWYRHLPGRDNVL